MRLVRCISSPAAAILVICMLVTPAAAAPDSKQVNAFYRQIVALLKGNGTPPPRTLASLVNRNPEAARICAALAEKRSKNGNKASEGFRILHEKLEEALLLAGHGKCRPDTINRILSQIRWVGWDFGERHYAVDRLMEYCPESVRPYHAKADLYYENGQDGMAVEAYEKALAMEDDPSSRYYLAEARRQLDKYKNQEPITDERARKHFEEPSMMGPSTEIVRKVQRANSLQRQILFEEWSSRIEGQYLKEVEAVGRAFRSQAQQEPSLKLLIEGHTDRRGPYEKNMRLSRQRAESVKRHIVDTCGVDPSRIETKGYGPDMPFSALDSPEGWTLNRRVEFKKLDH